MDSTARPLCTIADEIRADWKKVNPAAVPYLDAINSLTSVDDKYVCDSGKTMVAYFLSNASTWRGDTAKRIKAELKAMIK